MLTNNISSVTNLEIINFSDEFADAIKDLNYEWLQRFFRIEDSDARSLSNPRAEIIDKGGFVFYAKLGDEIIGTASLVKKSDNVFELAKMAVTASQQGNGIGTVLIEHCIAFAEEIGAQKLILYSNTKLTTAIAMYRKYGFSEIALETGLYERADIKMEKTLTNNHSI